MSRKSSFCAGLMLLAMQAGAVQAAEDIIPLEVSLGDVSLNKVAFLVAGDNGIYEKNGLKVRQFITANAANRIRRSGVNVPAEFVGTDEDEEAAPISVGGGSPLIVRMTSDARATNRVILATFEDTSKFHIISKKDLNSLEDLKG